MKGVLKVLGTLFILALLAVVVSSVSPIYRFRAPQPFTGADIFNPYQALDTLQGWKRANFHTHTRVSGPWPPNECPHDAAYTDSVYRALGYEIVTFSNHNELTPHPYDSTLQVNVYEQGYSPFKFHKLVFGSPAVKHWNPLLPFLTSQLQFELDRLGADADLLQINHPYRTRGLPKKRLERLSGYSLMELDTHVSTENKYWDWALSAGHYSFGVANDDLHHPERPERIAIRCNFVATPSARYEDLLAALRSGCFYSMRVPDYGAGDWQVKITENQALPFIADIGLDGETAFLTLSERADSIRVTGQDHRTLLLARDTASVCYALLPEDSYARFTAFFPDGAVIYTNPFARYDASARKTPFEGAPQPINLPLTLLYNLLLAAFVAALLRLSLRLWR